MVLKDEKGTRLYPVCSWERNQHKLYATQVRIQNEVSDAEILGEKAPYSALERIDIAVKAFDAHVVNGIVYAPYEIGQMIKNYIWAYDLRH